MNAFGTSDNEVSHSSNVRAVILAGGKGVRLKPFTATFPKPLVPLGNTPIVEILIRRLIRYGITDIVLSLGHLAELIQAYFEHRQELRQHFTPQYFVEDEPLGTAGSLSQIPNLDRTFLAMNGDLLTDLDFNELINYHRQSNAALTIATHQREIKIDLGVLECDEAWRVVGYREKPKEYFSVSMGVYVYEPKVLKFIEPGKHLDFPELVLRLIAANERVCAMPTNCVWLDIGRPDDYAEAQALYETNPKGFLS